MSEDITISSAKSVDMLASVVLEKFKTALLAVERVVGNRGTLPILNNVLIRADKGGVEIVATDLEIGIRCFVGGKVEVEGVITVPGKTLIGLINTLHGETVELKSSGDKVEVVCGETSVVLNGVSAEDYPVLPVVEDGVVVKVGARKFKQLVSQVDFAVSRDESRQILTGVYVVASEDGLTLAATDSHRLAEVVDSGDVGGRFKIIIPAKTINEIKRLIGEAHQDLNIQVSESQVVFSLDNAVVVSRLIEGEYPNYKQIIPAETKLTVEVDIADLTDAIKSAAVVSLDSGSSVRLVMGGERVGVVSESAEVGRFDGSIPAVIAGDDEEISFNAKYLLDGLAGLDTPKCVMAVSSKTAPVVIRPAGVDNQMYIVMPLKD